MSTVRASSVHASRAEQRHSEEISVYSRVFVVSTSSMKIRITSDVRSIAVAPALLWLVAVTPAVATTHQYQICDIGVIDAGDIASQGFGVAHAGIAVGRSVPPTEVRLLSGRSTMASLLSSNGPSVVLQRLRVAQILFDFVFKLRLRHHGIERWLGIRTVFRPRYCDARHVLTGSLISYALCEGERSMGNLR